MLDHQSAPPTDRVARDDAILPLTRALAAAVLPFLVAAFIILYLRPAETAQRFAWEIKSPLTAAVMGAGYLGGAYFFGRLLVERRWHRVAAGFPPVTVFTTLMLAATLLHWDTFDPGHWPFWVWLGIYLVTPILVPLAWRRNQPRDPGEAEPGDAPVPPVVGRVLFIIGLLLLAEVAILFLAPGVALDRWPWPLTPLTARVLASWQALLAAGALTLAGERRWSGWRIPLQSILLWQALVLVALVVYRDQFGPNGLLNWYALVAVGGVALAAAFYVAMERRRPAQP